MRPRHEYEEALRWIAWGMNDCQISRLISVPRGTIRDWRHGSRAFARHAGSVASERACPRCGEQELDGLSYSYLLGLYLGDGCLSLHRRGVYRLRIVLDQRYPNIIEECARAMAAVRRTHRVPTLLQRIGCIEVSAYWKHWICVFPQHGAGVKHRRSIRLEAWQRSLVEEYPAAFLRGLIQSDGWRGTNNVKVRGKRYSYPRYQFTNYSEDIRSLFCWACDLYGVRWKQMKWNTISIARRDDVAKLDLVIGLKS